MATEIRRSRGSIIQRSGDPRKWTLVIDLGHGANGKQKRRWKSFSGSRRAAEARLNELLADIDAGVYIKPTKVTLGAFFERWLRDYAATRVRPSTLDGYRFRSKRLREGLGNASFIFAQNRALDAVIAHSWAYIELKWMKPSA